MNPAISTESGKLRMIFSREPVVSVVSTQAASASSTMSATPTVFFADLTGSPAQLIAFDLAGIAISAGSACTRPMSDC